MSTVAVVTEQDVPQKPPKKKITSSGNVDDRAKRFYTWTLNVGFLFALIIAAVCFLFSAIYLNHYLSVTSDAVGNIVQQTAKNPDAMQLAMGARLAVAKYSLSSCGIVAGIAFGFLGFALFLLGVQGAMDASAKNDTGSVQLVHMAPGTFVLVCSVILIAISITHKIEYSSEPVSPPDATAPPQVVHYTAPELGHDPIP